MPEPKNETTMRHVKRLGELHADLQRVSAKVAKSKERPSVKAMTMVVIDEQMAAIDAATAALIQRDG